MEQRDFLDFDGPVSQLPKTIDFDSFSTTKETPQETESNLDKDGQDTLSVWCDECGVYNIGECFIHGDVTVAPDNELPSRAVLSLPKKILSLKKIKSSAESGKRGVIAKKAIKPRTQFGPMEGVKMTTKPRLANGCMEYELIDSHGGKVYLHLMDESKCNWMMFVRPASDFSTQNLAAFQKGDAVYFVTIKNIPAGTELLVWYSAAYAKCLGKEIFLPSNCIKKSSVSTNVPYQSTSKSDKGKQSVPTSSRKQKGKVASRERIPRTSRLRDPTTASGSLLECSICGTTFERVSQKISHICVDPDETEEDSLTEHGVRRRKGRPRKLVNNVDDPSKTINLPSQVTNPSLLPVTVTNDSNEDIASLLDDRKTKETSNGTSSNTLNGSNDVLSEYDFIPPSNEEISNNIEPMESSETLKDKNSGESETCMEMSDSSFTCDQCSYVSVSAEILKAHKLTHTKATEYICGVEGCSKIFGSRFKFLRHLNVHIKTNQYRCKICNSTFNRSDHLKNHLPIHACNRTKYSCDICGKSYLYKSTLLFHRAKHEANEGTSLTCLICQQKFDTSDDLKAHVNTHNRYKPDPNKEKAHKCPECNKRFLTSKDVNRHLITHSKERAFLCEHCPQTFVRKDHLRRHYISHHKKEIYESQMKTNMYGCPVCLKVFNKKEFLDYHMQDLHPNGIQEPEPPRKPRGFKEKRPDYIQNTQKTQISTLQDNLILHAYKPQAQQFQTPFVFPSNLQQTQQILQPSSQILQTQSPVQNKDIQQHQLESDDERLDFIHLSQALGLQPVQTSKALSSSQIIFPGTSQNTSVTVGKGKSLLNLPAMIKSDSVKLPEQILKFVTKQQGATQRLQNIEQLQQQNIQHSLSQQNIQQQQQKQQEQLQLKAVQTQSAQQQQQQQQQLLFQFQQQQQQQIQQQQQQQKQLQILNDTTEDKTHSVLTPTVTTELPFPNNIISLMSSLEPTKNIEWSLAGDPSSRNKVNVSSNTDPICEGVSPNLTINASPMDKPDHCYATVSVSQLQAASSAPPNNLSVAIADSNPVNSLKSASSSNPQEELLKLLSFFKPAKTGATLSVETETENQQSFKLKQEQLQNIITQPESQPQQQQEDFGNQQQVVANFPISWGDSTMADFNSLGDLSLANDASVIMAGGVTPMTNWIIQLPVNVQQPQQQQSIIQQPVQSQQQGQLIQDQHSQLQLLQQQAQLLQQQTQTQLFQQQQQQQQQSQIVQPQAQTHLLQHQNQQHKIVTIPISNSIS